ncbi:MAG: hypothetical protein JO006_10765 [Paucibacter sp.]|nr:hypothetical protein [Roseateles sp.]
MLITLSIALAASLALVLAHRLNSARLRRRQISPPAMRVHVSLLRLRRQGCAALDLPSEDVAALRSQLGRRDRRLWDASIEAYNEACREDMPAPSHHLDQLLSLTMPR